MLNEILKTLNTSGKDVTLTNVVDELKIRVSAGLNDATASEVLKQFKNRTKEGGN